MAIALNLSRDVRMFVSTVETGFTAADTYEVRVLDGFSVSQSSETTDVTIDEAGATPARGKKTFNTALNPVDVSFSTYARPYRDGSGDHTAIEQILWDGLVTGEGQASGVTEGATNMVIDFDSSNQHELRKLFLFVELGSGADKLRYKVTEAIVGQADIDFDINGITTITWTMQGRNLTQITADEMPGGLSTTFTAAPASAFFIKNKLSTVTVSGSYGAWVELGSPGAFAANDATDLTAGTYALDVTVDGGSLQQLSVPVGAGATFTQLATSITEAGDGTFRAVARAGTLIFESISYTSSSSIVVAVGTGGAANGDLLAELDTVTTGSGVSGVVAGAPYSADNSTAPQSGGYVVPLTGGSVSFNNNVTFLTPEELGVVNQNIGHFTGTRDISGTMTAYLRSGSNGTDETTAKLQKDLLLATSEVTTSFNITISIGGGSNTPRIDIAMPRCFLSVPSTETEDVMSTTIEFSALPTELDTTDEATVTYVSA